jgi:hypothetical protein
MTTTTATTTDSETALLERFESKLKYNPRTQCWVWTANTGRDGYGQFNLDGRQAIAHRLAYELYVNEIHEGYIVRQTCGNKLCCFNKLTEDQITQIHRLRLGGLSQQTIADKVGCSDVHVSCVLRGVYRQSDTPTLEELLEPTPYLLTRLSN